MTTTTNSDVKDRLILFGWIAGLLILISVIWFFSQRLQAYYLLKSVNSVFVNNEDERRLSAYIPNKTGKAGLLGYWFSMRNSTDRLFVFTIFQDGILVPLGAIVSDNGSVSGIIPLSAHAVQIFNDLPQSIVQMYITRIETAAHGNTEGNKR
ncbi:MAG: hypothetical protein LBQ93_02945 [Treponema sp.]|jgi:hypothetical protein|nr:hypothetical protein [Treponema sp.]